MNLHVEKNCVDFERDKIYYLNLSSGNKIVHVLAFHMKSIFLLLNIRRNITIYVRTTLPIPNFRPIKSLWRIEDTTEMVLRRKKRRFSGRNQSKQQGK